MKFSSLILSIMLILGITLATGCGDSPSAPDPPPPPEVKWVNPAPQLHGLWLFTSAQSNGSSCSLADALDWEDGSSYAAIQIEGDGTLYYAEFNDNFDITISGDGAIYTAEEPHTNKFKFNLTNDLGTTYEASGTWKVSGSGLTLDGTWNGESLRFTCEEI